MATLYIVEFDEIRQDAEGSDMQVGKYPGVAQQTVSFTSAAGATSFNAATTLIRVISTADCHIEMGGGVATAGSATFLPANVYEYMGVHSSTPLSVWDGATS